MKLKKFIMNYWGDIFFLLVHPLLYSIRNYTFFDGWYVNDNSILCFFIVCATFTVLAFMWVAFFWNSRRRVLRDLQYPLYCLLAATYLLVYYLDNHSYFLYQLTDRIFIAIALARFGFWFNERRGAKKADSTPDQSPTETP